MRRALTVLALFTLPSFAVACSSSSRDDSTSGAGPAGGAAQGGASSMGGTSSVGGTSSTGGTSSNPTGGTSSTGGGTTLGNCPVFPADNAWNRDVSGDPVDPMSDAYMASMNGGSKKLHPDFGSDPTYGIPYVLVPGSQPKVPMTFTYSDESDPGPYPFPMDAPVEGGPGATGDRHVLAVDTDNCILYETYNSNYVGPGWMCDSGAVFNLKSDMLRPDGWTSADAAGLPIFPGLARRVEVMAGAINHALRFTVQKTQKAYVHPATHQAGDSTDATLPPMGLRVRMKASYDLSKVTGASLVILTALKKYGMFVADNGSDWYISGATDTSWDDDDLDQIKQVPASAFEVVQLGTIMTGGS